MLETEERPETEERKDWMAVLAKAPAQSLVERFAALGAVPPATWLRAPESGTIMVRGRTGATGAAFNLGEMTVTRCTLRLEDGTTGHATVAGRDHDRARMAAHCDALLQGGHAERVRREVLDPLRAQARAQRAGMAARAEATRVDFFTMARGKG